jgi:hypothetical protein
MFVNISCNKRNTTYATYEYNNWNLKCTDDMTLVIMLDDAYDLVLIAF